MLRLAIWSTVSDRSAGCRRLVFWLLAALAATGRFMFPNVLNEPPQQFKAGFPQEYGVGVDERWKDKYGIWVVRTTESRLRAPL